MGITDEMARRSLVGKNGDNAPQRRRGLFVRIVKRRVMKNDAATTTTGDGGEVQLSKLAVGISGGYEDKFETLHRYSVVVMDATNGIEAELPYDDTTKHTFPADVTNSIESIIHHAGLAVKQDLSAWELNDEIPISKYAAGLPFVDNGVIIPSDPSEWTCQKTGKTSEHLWLNLSDGYIGGGRKHWDGSGGTNGALDHYIETGERYPLVVKLGTITEDIDTADCYSYAKDEDGPVKIPNLKELLEKRGIKIAGLQKTVKSTAELEVELNATYAFDAIVEKVSMVVSIELSMCVIFVFLLVVSWVTYTFTK